VLAKPLEILGKMFTNVKVAAENTIDSLMTEPVSPIRLSERGSAATYPSYSASSSSQPHSSGELSLKSNYLRHGNQQFHSNLSQGEPVVMGSEVGFEHRLTQEERDAYEDYEYALQMAMGLSLSEAEKMANSSVDTSENFEIPSCKIDGVKEEKETIHEKTSNNHENEPTLKSEEEKKEDLITF